MTAPFGAVLEAALKDPIQNASFSMSSGLVCDPDWFCCITGTSVGIDKNPVAVLKPDSGRRVCTCTAVTVDYSGSWSPTSTINTWSVNWGDGNVTNGGWPGAGTTSHPGGGPGCNGYLLPGTYTITLTVTDLLGATHSASFQIEAIDCATFATIEAYLAVATPGVSGVWYTNDGGGNWADRGGNVLGNTLVYDLKINPFTVPVCAYDPIDNTEFVELWAATEKGLYKATDGARTGTSWKPVESFPTTLSVWAVQPSIYSELEVYVLATNAANDRVWVYRTIDGGLTWTNVELIPGAGTYNLEDRGWSHMMVQNSTGAYIYVGMHQSTGNAVVVRVDYDLGATIEVFSEPSSSGMWCRCDYNMPAVLWASGGLNDGTSVYVSGDDGLTWEDASPVWTSVVDDVRFVLPSLYNPADLIAYNQGCGDIMVFLAASANHLRTYSVDSDGNLTFETTEASTTVALDAWSDGQFVFVAAGAQGIFSFRIESDWSLTYIDSDAQVGVNGHGIWSDGDFIYLAGGNLGLLVYSADAVGNLTYVGSSGATAYGYGIWGDGSFLYLADGSGGLRTYTVDGLGALTFKDSDYKGSGEYVDVHGDGGFIYVSVIDIGVVGRALLSYSVAGAGVLTLEDNVDPGVSVRGVWTDGVFVYAACTSLGLFTYTVDGAGSFTFKDSDDQGGSYYGVHGAGGLIFVANATLGIMSYSVGIAGALTYIDSIATTGFRVFAL